MGRWWVVGISLFSAPLRLCVNFLEAFCHSQPEQRIVVDRRIIGAPASQNTCQLIRGTPIGLGPGGKANTVRHAGNMYVEGTDELRRSDLVPDAEIDSCFILTNHPAQEHAKPFTRRASGRSAYVFSRTFGMFILKKVIVEMDQRGSDRVSLKAFTGYKCVLQ